MKYYYCNSKALMIIVGSKQIQKSNFSLDDVMISSATRPKEKGKLFFSGQDAELIRISETEFRFFELFC